MKYVVLVCGFLLALFGLAFIADQLMDIGKDTSESHPAIYIVGIAFFGVLPLMGGAALVILHKQMGRNVTKVGAGFIVLMTAWLLYSGVLALGDQGHGMLALCAHEDSSSPYYSDLELSVGPLDSPQFVGDEFQSYFEIVNTGEALDTCILTTCWREDLHDEWISGQSHKTLLETGKSYEKGIRPFTVSETGYAARGHFERAGTYTYSLYVFDYTSVVEHSDNLDPRSGVPPFFERSDERFSNLAPIKTITASVVVYERE